MAYAATTDMIARFGEQEMILLTTKKGDPLDAIVPARSDQALDEASGTIDSYLRRRYLVPLAPPYPPEIARAVQVLARYDLAFGADTSPSEQMRLARKEVIVWLDGLADGRLTLDGLEPSGDYSAAMTSDRVGRLQPGLNVGDARVLPQDGYDPEWPTTW